MQSRSSGGVGGDWRKRRGSESSESSSAGNDNDIYDGELLPQDNDDYVVTHQIASDSDDDDSGRGVPSVAGGGPASAGASPPSASPGADADDGRGSVTPVIASRAYQLEMFEASMRENVIVAVRS